MANGTGHLNNRPFEKQTTSCQLFQSLHSSKGCVQILNESLFSHSLQVVEYEGSNHMRNLEMQRVLLTHEVICRSVFWLFLIIHNSGKLSNLFFLLNNQNGKKLKLFKLLNIVKDIIIASINLNRWMRTKGRRH